MTRNPLILVTLALGLVLGGCSNRSIGRLSVRLSLARES